MKRTCGNHFIGKRKKYKGDGVCGRKAVGIMRGYAGMEFDACANCISRIVNGRLRYPKKWRVLPPFSVEFFTIPYKQKSL